MTMMMTMAMTMIVTIVMTMVMTFLLRYYKAVLITIIYFMLSNSPHFPAATGAIGAQKELDSLATHIAGPNYSPQ